VHIHLKPDPQPPRGTEPYVNPVVARLDTDCTCGNARLEVLRDRHGRPVAVMVHATPCELGAHIDGQPGCVVTAPGGGRGDDGTDPPTAGPLVRPGADYSPWGGAG
jgi:hypothetical protein